MSDDIHVAVRVRPLIERELSRGSPVLWQVQGSDQIQQTDCKGHPIQGSSFTFDRVFSMSSRNSEVYKEICHPIVGSVMDGFHGTIFAYGQTSSGKTYTMMGGDQDPGVIMKAIEDIFDMHGKRPNREYLFKVSYMEIYNEKISDLISNSSNLVIKENLEGQVFVSNLEEVLVSSAQGVLKVMEAGEKNRHFGETAMNDHSSRSHTIFKMVVQSRIRGSGDDSPVNISHLNLVDLAGSEKAGQMGSTGNRFKEGVHINRSLLTLSQVISKLSEGAFVNYRDSKLTRILQNSLGGNSRTAIICTVTPTSTEQTQSTLNFAVRAKKIRNKPVVNEVLTDAAQVRIHVGHIASMEREMRKKESIIADLMCRLSGSSPRSKRTTSLKRSAIRNSWSGSLKSSPASSGFFFPDPRDKVGSTPGLPSILEGEEIVGQQLPEDPSCEVGKEEMKYEMRNVSIRKKRCNLSLMEDEGDIALLEEFCGSLSPAPSSTFLDIAQPSPQRLQLQERINQLHEKNCELHNVIERLEKEHQELQEYTIMERQIHLDGTVFGEGRSLLSASNSSLSSGSTVTQTSEADRNTQTDHPATQDACTSPLSVQSSPHLPQDSDSVFDPTRGHVDNVDTTMWRMPLFRELVDVTTQTVICCEVDKNSEENNLKLQTVFSNTISQTETVSVADAQLQTSMSLQTVSDDKETQCEAFVICRNNWAVQTDKVRIQDLSSLVNTKVQTESAVTTDSNSQTDIVETRDMGTLVVVESSEVEMATSATQTTEIKICCAFIQTEDLVDMANAAVQTEDLLLVNAVVQTEELDMANAVVQTEELYMTNAIIKTEDAVVQTEDPNEANAVTQTDAVIFCDGTCKSKPAITGSRSRRDVKCQTDNLPVESPALLSCTMTVEDFEDEISHWKDRSESLQLLLESKLKISEDRQHASLALNHRLAEDNNALQLKISELGKDLAKEKRDVFHLQCQNRKLEKSVCDLQSNMTYYKEKLDAMTLELRRAQRAQMDHTVVELRKKAPVVEESPKPAEEEYGGLGVAGIIKLSMLEKEITVLKKKCNVLIRARKNCHCLAASSEHSATDSKENLSYPVPPSASSTPAERPASATSVVQPTPATLAVRPASAIPASSMERPACALATDAPPRLASLRPPPLPKPWKPQPLRPFRVSPLTESQCVTPPLNTAIPVNDFTLDLNKGAEKRRNTNTEKCNQQ